MSDEQKIETEEDAEVEGHGGGNWGGDKRGAGGGMGRRGQGGGA